MKRLNCKRKSVAVVLTLVVLVVLNSHLATLISAEQISGDDAWMTNLVVGSPSGIAAVAPQPFTLASSPCVGMGAFGNGAYPGAVADVNGDGKPDLICANGSLNTLTILTNNGNGVFGSNATLNVGAGMFPIAVVAADVNEDGRPALICANNRSNSLTIYTNNGGVFGFNATIPAGNNPNRVIAADLNGDGKMDLAVTDYNGKTVTLLTNNGSGGFVAAPPVNVPAGALGITAADVNGDGKVDLICVNNSVPGVLTVLTNNGSGGFAIAASVGVGREPISVVAADIYGNGHPAVVTASQLDNTLTVLTNLGGGIFSSNASYTVGADPFYVTAADLNADGKVDLICANSNDGTLTVLTNTGSGQFALNATLSINASAYPDFVAAADLNGDGKPDLAALDYGLGAFSIFLNNTVFHPGDAAAVGGSVSASTFRSDDSGLISDRNARGDFLPLTSK